MNDVTTISTQMSNGDAIYVLYRALPAQRRHDVWLTIALMLLGALAEVLSVGSIVPFLAVLTDSKALAAIPIVGDLLAGLPLGTDLVMVTALAFMVLFLLSGLLRLLLVKVSQALAFNVAYDLSIAAFGKLVRQPYPYYVARTSGEALSQFEKLNHITFTVFIAGVQALISSFIALLLIVLLIVINPLVAFISAGTMIGTYILISFAVQPTLKRNSTISSVHAGRKIKQVQEALGGIRDILLDRSQPVFEREFAHSADRFRHVSAINAFIGHAPRIMIEMVGMVMIGGYAWHIAGQPGGVTAAIPMLGALALGAQRLLPLLQQAYSGWSSLISNRQNVLDVVDLLSLGETILPEPIVEAARFRRSIRFKAVGFAYPTGGQVVREIDFVVAKGERIGIAGSTGSGKSTLMDLLLGLLEPSSGAILIDDVPLDGRSRAAWQGEIAHVPQAIYLTDDSIAANIAFGITEHEIDFVRVEQAARSAGIAEFIVGLPQGYATRAGERGIRLSGGQRQRIGIARALYKRASVLVFDEATSALDTRTEEGVMASIATLGSDVTIVMIAHRLTTLRDCDRIIHLEHGRIERLEERSFSKSRES